MPRSFRGLPSISSEQRSHGKQLTLSRQEGVVASPNEYPILQMRVKLEHKGILVRKADKGVRRAKSIERDKSYNLVVLFISSKDNRFLDIRKIE